MGTFMSNRTDDYGVQIDRIHSRAICEEVGARLRSFGQMEPSDVPPHLRMLIGELQELEQRH